MILVLVIVVCLSAIYVIFDFLLFLFFFFKQKTAYEMRISDWSSDVCSSDLHRVRPRLSPARRRLGHALGRAVAGCPTRDAADPRAGGDVDNRSRQARHRRLLGRRAPRGLTRDELRR